MKKTDPLYKEYLPYRLALEFKEMGYSQTPPRLGGYDKEGCLHYRDISNTDISAPLWQQAFDWIREEHNTSILISDSCGWGIGFSYIITVLHGNKILFRKGRPLCSIIDSLIPTYEEARELAITRWIEEVKKLKQ
jgi:hypothetical protein